MNPILKNILAVVAGWLGGSVVNMGLVGLGLTLFPVEGMTPFSTEMPATPPDLAMGNFLFTFLAHALGTLAGALIAYRIAANNKMKFALGIGAFFLIGGIAAVSMIPAPTWFAVMDLTLAYIPMAWLGGKIGERMEKA